MLKKWKKSTQAMAESEILEQPHDITPENTAIIEEKEPQIEYEKDDLFDFQEEDDLLWQADNQFDQPEYESSVTERDANR